jgi:predicted Ser/Thr protein kinase
MEESPLTDETQRYQLAECVGRGGLGAVYRAWDGRLERWVAIKRLTAVSTFAAEEVLAAMRREATALAALQHPNVVTVHDFGADEEGPYVVMEYIEGRTLDDCVTSAPFDYTSFLDLAEQTLSGLAAAHRAGLLHRDLKPGNIMLTAEHGAAFQVKILDFGLAKFAAQPTEQTVDQAGTLLGSIYFMAPEQFRRGQLDARTDLYAVGCILYFALTDRHPFDGETVAETMGSHLQHAVRPLKDLRPDVPEAVADWVMRLLSLDPADRPAGAAEALAILRALKGGTGAMRAGGHTGGGNGRWRKRPAILAATTLFLILAALAGSGAYVFRTKPAPPPPVAAPPMLPLVSLVADMPSIPAKGTGPGTFTISRSGDKHAPLTVTYQINGSAKNGVDYKKIPKSETIPAGQASTKIVIVPVDNDDASGKRHVRLTLLPSDMYRVGTVGEVKMNIQYDR